MGVRNSDENKGGKRTDLFQCQLRTLFHLAKRSTPESLQLALLSTNRRGLLGLSENSMKFLLRCVISWGKTLLGDCWMEIRTVIQTAIGPSDSCETSRFDFGQPIGLASTRKYLQDMGANGTNAGSSWTNLVNANLKHSNSDQSEFDEIQRTDAWRNYCLGK